jgi:hypothetical protein
MTMPWKSEAQRRWGHTEAGRKALGDKAVEEFDEASKGKKRPERAKNKSAPKRKKR